MAATPMSWKRLIASSVELLSKNGLSGSELDRVAEKFARERLLAHTLATRCDNKKNVLFLCGHNAGRSQMSAAWFNHRMRTLNARENSRENNSMAMAFSAGSNPATMLNKNAVAVMLELGIDMASENFPKPWTIEYLQACPYVITMGCNDKCSVLPGSIHRDWPLPDPHGQGLDAVRQVRDSVIQNVDSLVAELLGQSRIERNQSS